MRGPPLSLSLRTQVAGVDRSTGLLSWNAVYLFGHRNAEVYQPYVTLTTASGKLQMSPRHFIAVCVAACAGAAPAMRYR